MFRFIGYGEKAGSGADIIAKGWKENHWARPTIKDSYFPSEETELVLDLEKVKDQSQNVVGGVVEDGVEIPSASSMAKQIKTSSRTIQRELAYLRTEGKIHRVDGENGSYWEIIEKTEK